MGFRRNYSISLIALIACFLWAIPLVSLTTASPAQQSLARGKRLPWTSSRLKGSPEPPLPYEYELAFPHLRFNSPVAITNAPGNSRLFVVDVHGRIVSFENKRDVKSTDLMLDVKSGDPKMKQVYSFAFHPNFEENPYVYVCIIRAGGLDDGSRISRFTVTDMDPPRADPKSEVVIYTWYSGGHNGCSVKFGPEGYLYFSTGDGTGPNPPDPKAVGQDLSNVHSTVMRIDVDRRDEGKNYRIPPDNPFVDVAGARPEIWAYGFRNPWKMSFDRETGDLWVGDVGWEAWEMIYLVKRGGNYGWSVMEGRQPVHPDGKRGPTPILPPVKDHDHFEARSITGGFVYRGTALPGLDGAYVYGDYSTGRMWGFRYDGERIIWLQELVDTPLRIVAFGEDAPGELYFLDYQEMSETGEGGGGIYRLVPNPEKDESDSFPRTLSATGLFSSVEKHLPASGVVPYSVATELWADYAYAERFIAVPGDQPIDGEAGYPEGTVLARTVYLDQVRGEPSTRRRIETQILLRDRGNWRPYTYVWNAEQTDATLAESVGADLTFSIKDPNSLDGSIKHAYRVPSRAECSICHTDKLGTLLGVSPAQLNHQYNYGAGAENQIAVWKRLGIYSNPIPEKELAKRMVHPFDSSASLDDRARSYLHANCGHCHRPGGGGTAMINFDYRLEREATRLVDIKPAQGAFGLKGSRIVAPGDPFASVLFYRMTKLGRGHMPHIGSAITDRRGLELVYDWIAHLSPESSEAVRGGVGSESSASVSAAFRGQLKSTLQAFHEAASLPASSCTKVLRYLFSSTRSALLVSHVLSDESNEVPSEVREELVAIGTEHLDVNIRDLFEQFVPPEKRTQRLGERIEPHAILSLEGDVERGRRAFFYGAASSCRNCHRVHDAGGQVGPPLTEIGKKYKPHELLSTILDPSKQIEDKYRAYVAISTTGDVVSGLLIEKNSEWVTIKGSDGKVVRSPVAEIAQLTPQEKSLMPEFLLRDMTAQEAADLLAFLSALK